MNGNFPTTHWSAVLAAADGGGARSGAALAELCEAYWPPLYAFVRRQGVGADDARDLVQGYFTLLLEKRYLGDVHPERGRFRSFLLVSMKHFVSNERDRQRARKRAPAERLLSIDTEEAEDRLRLSVTSQLDPEQVFEQRWALTLLERALARLGEEATADGTRERFERLRGFLTDGDGTCSYHQVAEALGTSEGAVKTAVYRLRQRFGELLRDEVARTVVRHEEVDGELRHLLHVITPGVN